MSSTTKSKTKARREPRDTGFPEPFNEGRCTTLPHPDADLSPNACISQEDLSSEHANTRTRRSFMRRRNNNKYTLGHGRITNDSEAAFSTLSLTNTESGDQDKFRPISPSTSSARLSKDGAESIVSHHDEETPPTSPDVAEHRSKRGGFLKKLLKD